MHTHNKVQHSLGRLAAKKGLDRGRSPSVQRDSSALYSPTIGGDSSDRSLGLRQAAKLSPPSSSASAKP
jgi:hypothetical protein